ncbi:MAG: hypothetical protein V1837_07980 [Candidatus Woesearchaeota archaeon]
MYCENIELAANSVNPLRVMNPLVDVISAVQIQPSTEIGLDSVIDRPEIINPEPSIALTTAYLVLLDGYAATLPAVERPSWIKTMLAVRDRSFDTIPLHFKNRYRRLKFFGDCHAGLTFADLFDKSSSVKNVAHLANCYPSWDYYIVTVKKPDAMKCFIHYFERNQQV